MFNVLNTTETWPRIKKRGGARAVDLGRPKFEIKHEAAVFKTVSLFIEGPSMSIGETRPPLEPALGGAITS